MVTIRRAVPDDAEAIWRLHTASIRTLCASHYTPEQIAAWTDQLVPIRYIKGMRSFDFFVAEDQGLVGFGIANLNRREVNALYIAPQEAGRGIGRRMMMHIEDLARSHGVSELGLNSTLNAVSFYQSLGYELCSHTSNVFPNGLELPCARMHKDL